MTHPDALPRCRHCGKTFVLYHLHPHRLKGFCCIDHQNAWQEKNPTRAVYFTSDLARPLHYESANKPNTKNKSNTKKGHRHREI